jgi:hypothetical protein
MTIEFRPRVTCNRAQTTRRNRSSMCYVQHIIHMLFDITTKQQSSIIITLIDNKTLSNRANFVLVFFCHIET